MNEVYRVFVCVEVECEADDFNQAASHADLSIQRDPKSRDASITSVEIRGVVKK